jgi:hypothetical protein
MEAGARTEKATHKLPEGQYKHLVVGPSARADFVPDALIIYGNAAQVMRLVVGALWKRGGALTSSFTGRVDCSDEIIATMMTGDYQVILPCYGESGDHRADRFRCDVRVFYSFSGCPPDSYDPAAGRRAELLEAIIVVRLRNTARLWKASRS